MCDSVLGNKFNTTSDAGKKIILTPSLFMRLLEWAKEDAKDDIALHQVFEKIMAFTDGTNPVGIECYDALIKDATGSSLPPESDEEDLANAEEMGKQCATCGADLSDVDYSDVGSIIMQDKDNGYGASNAELEKFWNGYETGCCVNPQDIECVAPSCCQNITPAVDGMTITIDSEDGACCDGAEECCVEEIPTEYDAQVEDIIKLGQF